MELERLRRSITRMPTGLGDAVDAVLPRGGISVVLGGAGSGKTRFGVQVLACGARDCGDTGILVALGLEEAHD